MSYKEWVSSLNIDDIPYHEFNDAVAYLSRFRDIHGVRYLKFFNTILVDNVLKLGRDYDLLYGLYSVYPIKSITLTDTTNQTEITLYCKNKDKYYWLEVPIPITGFVYNPLELKIEYDNTSDMCLTVALIVGMLSAEEHEKIYNQFVNSKTLLNGIHDDEWYSNHFFNKEVFNGTWMKCDRAKGWYLEKK